MLPGARPEVAQDQVPLLFTISILARTAGIEQDISCLFRRKITLVTFNAPGAVFLRKSHKPHLFAGPAHPTVTYEAPLPAHFCSSPFLFSSCKLCSKW
jgi:hypothetical protein